MTDPILYLSMILGLGGVYVLISSFHDDDDGDDDGEKYIYNLGTNLFSKIVDLSIKKHYFQKVSRKNQLPLKIVL